MSGKSTFRRGRHGRPQGPVRQLLFGTVMLLSAVAVAQDAELLPAAMGIRTDDNGNTWNVEPNGSIGRVGSTMINSGLVLSVNDDKFTGTQPTMTKDGKEFVIESRQFPTSPGLQVTRRIRLMEGSGGLRYIESFSNGSANPLVLNVALTNNFSGNYKTFLADTGISEPVILKDRESGLLVLPGTSQSNKAYLFSLATPDSPSKPTVSAKNRYGLTFHFRLEVAPGETRSLVHTVSQVVIPQNFDRRNLQKIFRPFTVESQLESLSDTELAVMENAPVTGEMANSRNIVPMGIQSLGLNRGPRDILAIGEKTRIAGKASCDSFYLSTGYGEAEIPFDSIAAIAGGKYGMANTIQVFLEDGQVFSGSGRASNLIFTLANGGTMNLDLPSLDRLVRAKEEPARNAAWPKGVIALVETHSGDRFTVKSGDKLTFKGATPWGELSFSITDLAWMGPTPGEPVGQFVELQDGTRCLVYFAGDDVTLPSDIFGEVAISLEKVRSVVTAPGVNKQSVQGVERMPTLHLRGNQEVHGKLIGSEIKLGSENQVITFAANDIRSMIQEEEKSGAVGGLPISTPVFRIETWDGSVASGLLILDAFSAEIGTNLWNIPPRDIRSIEFPYPMPGESAKEGIVRLIEQLGSPDWNTREKATRELGAFGYLARPLLEQERNRSTDPEVIRRINRILLKLN